VGRQGGRGAWLARTSPAPTTPTSTTHRLAVDRDGNVYVGDHGNNRVMVFDKEGKLLGKFAADKPYQLAVHPASGEIT